MHHLSFRRREDPRQRIQTLRAYAELARPEDPDLADRLWKLAEAEESWLGTRREVAAV